MHRSVQFLLVLCLLCVVAVDNHSFIPPAKLFETFMERYNVTYATPEEQARRLEVFRENLAIAERMNKEHIQIGGARVFGMSKFMDLTRAEFKARYLNNANLPDALPQAPVKYVPPPHTRDIPVSFDWSSKGVITPVKNQEQCGSCWAFSATETIESAWALAGHGLVVLGPQQIVDCDTTDYGCDGGWPYNAYAYVISAGGQEPEADYPYTGVDGTCAFNIADVAVTIANWTWVNQNPATETTTMLDFVANMGPVSVCVDASSWQFYTGGVLQQCGTNVDHCVQVTGFQNMDSLDVWNVRNSWGAWGDNDSGYLYIERGMNLCLIATYVTSAASA